MSEVLVNKVSNSGLITLDLEKFMPSGEPVSFDLKDYLFMELILKEKDFRESLKNLDWSAYEGKKCSCFLQRGCGDTGMGIYACGNLPGARSKRSVHGSACGYVQTYLSEEYCIHSCG